MDSLNCEYTINLKLIRRFFTNDSASLYSVVKTYERHFKDDSDKIKIYLYLNKMMIFLLEILEDFDKKPDKANIKAMLKSKCDNKYALYTQSFDFFTEIQSIIAQYLIKKNTEKIEESDIIPTEVISLKVLLEDDTTTKISKNHLILNKALVNNYITHFFNNNKDNCWS